MMETIDSAGPSATDTDIQLIRTLTALSVVFTHFLEIYGYRIAWWTNFGVQVFLFISGYLFGGRQIRDWREWYGKRLLRILPAYYLLITAVFLANGYLLKPAALWRAYLASALCIQDFVKVHLPGCDHLWYVTLILTCYLTVPALQALRNRVRGVRQSILVFFVALPAAYFLIYKVFDFLTYSYVANLSAFAWGYWIGGHRKQLLNDARFRRAVPLVIAAAGLVLAGRWALEATKLNQAGLWRMVYDKLLFPWSKVGEGATLFLIFVGRHWKIGATRPVSWIATHSYEIYLTHHIFIFGTLSLVAWLRPPALAMLMILFLTGCSAYLVRRGTAILPRMIKEARLRRAPLAAGEGAVGVKG